MEKRILQLINRFAEVENLLGDPQVHSDQKRYKKLTQEHAYLSEIKETWDQCQKLQKQLSDDQELYKEETNQELLEMLRDEIESLKNQIPLINTKLETLLVPPDPNDSRNTIIEVRAGTGGDEAALLSGI